MGFPNLRSYYQETAAIFDQIRLDREQDIKSLSEIVSREAAPGSHTRLLDAGCGTGRYLAALSRLGYEAFGIDRSLAQLTHGAVTGRTALANIAQLPLADNILDVIVVCLVLHQLGRDEQLSAYSDWKRTLRPSGKLFIKTCSHADLRCRSFADFFPSALEINLSRYPDVGTIESDLRGAGFRVLPSVPTYSEEVFPTETYLWSVAHKHNTTLALLPEREFHDGLAALRAALCGNTSVTISHRYTILMAVTNK